MRSQTSKPSPKKGVVSKTNFKASSNSKQSKKKSVSPKKVKNIVHKTLAKGPKKKLSKDDITNKTDGESSSGDKSDSSSEICKAGPSRTNPRCDSPAKKSKKEPKEKKDTSKNSTEVTVKKVAPKKSIKPGKKVNKKSTNKKSGMKIDDIKYKINVDAAKKTLSKFSKAKTVVKKGNVANKKKKLANIDKPDVPEKEQEDCDIDKDVFNESEGKKKSDNKEEFPKELETLTEEKMVTKEEPTSPLGNATRNAPATITSDTRRTETERPPKFFTSSRTPRTVDIDVKCCKTSKGNLTVSERFLSMKLETKTDDDNKEKSTPNTLVSQGPDIDVYTFTEKVDSPKSILSDFRSPIPKNVGRVRPIARVKGTVIDKKTESEKKKYSPHRPIEEVVKQLKAIKKSEELNASVTQIPISTSNDDTVVINEEKNAEDNPKPIVSKSYKMVARKSSVTGKPFSPIKFLYQEPSATKIEKSPKTISPVFSKKPPSKPKKQQKKPSISDEDIDTSKFALNTTFHYTSSDDSVNESNDDNDTKESSGSDTPKSKKMKNKKFKRITDSAKKSTSSKELKELSKDSLVDLKDNSLLLGEKPSKRRLKLLSMWTGPKKHRMASLNAMAKVHCLYENESRTHMELGLMKTIDRQVIPGTSKTALSKKKDSKSKDTGKFMTSTSESEYESKTEKRDESSESSDDIPPSRTLRGVPGIRSAGKYWDPKSSTSSSEDSELETKKKTITPEKKKANTKTTSAKSDTEKPPAKMKKTAGVPVKKKRNRNEVVMDLKDMVVQKRMASLNATAILAASYEKRSPKSSKDGTTSDSCSDESFCQKPKNGASSGVKSETKSEETKKEIDETSLTDRKQKVEVIVNQDTDVTITGVYSTHHEGFCTAMQYRISSTSHTQTTATANCEKEGCSREDGSRYTPLSALSSMQPPAEHAHNHPHPVPELGGLTRRAGCSSAFSAPSPAAHHEPGLGLRNLLVGLFNAGSLSTRHEEFIVAMEELGPDVMAINETWLRAGEEDKAPRLEGYRLKHTPRPKQNKKGRGGGVGFYIRKGLNVRICPYPNVSASVEQMWISVRLNNQEIVIGTAYRPQWQDIDIFFDAIAESVASFTEMDGLVLAGDFNINLLDESSARYRDFTQWTRSLNLDQLVSEPTHFTDHSSSLIDVFCTDIRALRVIVKHSPEMGGHAMVLAELKIKKEKISPYWISFRALKDIVLDQFDLDLRSIDWVSLGRIDGVNGVVEAFTKCVVGLLDLHAPIKKRRFKHPPPSMDNRHHKRDDTH